MTLPRKARALDYRSRLAIEGVLAGKSRPNALKDAGYSPSYAVRRAGWFFNRPEVAKALEEGWAKIREKKMYTATTAMNECAEVIKLAIQCKNPMSYVKAVELRAKISGLLTDVLRIEHVDIRGAIDEARNRTIPWNQYRQLKAPAIDPFEG
jgi:hypothetical protein